jgi:Tol biopolymer transport system component/DNA-binding winged helix-turn-helix (wHTH) protein
VIYLFENFELRDKDFSLTKAGNRVRLEPKAMQVLLVLVSHAGWLVDKQILLEQVWRETIVEENALTRTIAVLRRELGDDSRNPRLIETVPTRGYRFVALVQIENSESVAAVPKPPEPAPPILPAVPVTAPKPVHPWLQRRVIWTSLVAGVALLGAAITIWLHQSDRFWRNPIADARFQTITDLEGVGQAAAISRDGHFVAFLSDRDGQTDVWVTQVGSGQFHNLTHGSEPDIANPSVRTLGFSPDGSLVTFWVRKRGGSNSGEISVWAVPTLGGQPRPYLEGVAEYDWSPDGSQLVYHTPGPGDPLFIANGPAGSDDRRIFTAPQGLHSHFPLWSPDKEYIYFVQGTPPDKLDIWRIPARGGTPERITSQNTRVTYPVLLDRRRLLYLAADPDGSGQWLYGMDPERRIPHKLAPNLDRYTSLAASTDGHRLVATHGATKKSLWRLKIDEPGTHASEAVPISLTTASGFSPRLGPDYLLYVSATGSGDSIWKLANGVSTELWSGPGAHIIGGPAIERDGQRVAFSVQQQSRSLLYVMQADGTNARIVSDGLVLQGAPAWTPDGQSITVAADDDGTPHLFRVPVDRRSPTSFVRDYSVDPIWEPNGGFVIYSGPDVGTTFPVHGITPEAVPHPLPQMNLTRGARHMAFLPGGRALLLLRGEIQHKDLWTVDLKTGAERQITNLPADFDIRDFDISPDGREVVLERLQEPSDVVLLDLPQH